MNKSLRSALAAAGALLLLAVSIGFTGCSQWFPASLNGNGGPASPTSGTPVPGVATPQTTQPQLDATRPADLGLPITPETQQPLELRLWLPPQFDPDSGSPAGEIFKQRLEEFSARIPGLTIAARVKEVDAQGGILDTLTTAGMAAQLALPDLVVLPYEELEGAALKGLLYPFDNLSDVLDEGDWYDFAQTMARVEKNIYGLPIAADGLVQVYVAQPAPAPAAALDWQALLSAQEAMIFTAADPQALFTLTQYLALGGAVQNDEGRPTLEAEPLKAVLDFYLQANTAGRMPYWLTSYQSDDQAWDAFEEGKGQPVITWSSRYLAKRAANPNLSMAPVPTQDGKALTLGTGWVWALTSPNPANHPLSVQLAEFLSEPEFLARWSEALGLLPPRPGALDGWRSSVAKEPLGAVASSLMPFPSDEVLSALGRALEQATVSVLKGQARPGQAAQDAVAQMER